MNSSEAWVRQPKYKANRLYGGVSIHLVSRSRTPAESGMGAAKLIQLNGLRHLLNIRK